MLITLCDISGAACKTLREAGANTLFFLLPFLPAAISSVRVMCFWYWKFYSVGQIIQICQEK